MIRNTKGFTLIELMIVIALIGFVLLIMGDILNFNIKRFNQDSSYYKYKVYGRYAMNKVVSEIKKNYNASFDSGKIKASDGVTVLINSNKNEASGDIRYYYEADKYGVGDGYGELRYQDGSTLAKNIKDFTIESTSSPDLVKVTIKAGAESTKKIFELVTYIRLYN